MGNNNDKNFGGDGHRGFLMGLESGWHSNPNCFNGFLTAVQMGVLDVMIKFINRDPDSTCVLSNDELAMLTGLSKASLKRVIGPLVELGILKSKRTNKTAIRKLNEEGVRLLDKIVDGQMYAGAFLREDMERKNIKSLFDVTDEMIESARKKSKELYLKNFGRLICEPSEMGLDGSYVSHRYIYKENNNKENNVFNNKGGKTNLMNIFKQGQEYTKEEEKEKLKKRKERRTQLPGLTDNN